ncbi:MAG: hypothetical protein WBB23_19735 [Desulforhopalus sp.]
MDKRESLRSKFINEMTEFLIIFAYLAVFFGVFTTYTRMLMAEYQIGYEHYGISIIKALILAKVIMLGDIFRLGQRLKNKPLFYHTLYKAIVFTGWVLIFHVIELIVGGLLHGKGLAGGVAEIMSEVPYQMLGHILIVFFAFLPFFAIRELGNVLGEGRIRELFFKRPK